jgi:hypothetical protein
LQAKTSQQKTQQKQALNTALQTLKNIPALIIG